MSVLVRMCVCRLCMFVHVRSGRCTLAGDGCWKLQVGMREQLLWWRSSKTCKTNFYKTLNCEASLTWKQYSHFLCHLVDLMYSYFDSDE